MTDAVGLAQYIDGKYGLAGLVMLTFFAFVGWRLYIDGKKSPPKDAGAAAESILGEIADLKKSHKELADRVRVLEILAGRLDERTTKL